MFKVADHVTCLTDSIDKPFGKGLTGVVTGFARLSSYHSREVCVKFEDGRSAWFWVSSVELEEV